MLSSIIVSLYDSDDKHSYALDAEGFTVSIEISISYDHVWENADMIIEASDFLMKKVEDQFPDCLAGEPKKLVSNCGIEEVIIDYAFHDKYKGQDFKATGAIVYIPFGEKMVQASFMYLDFFDNGANYKYANLDFLDMICSVRMIKSKAPDVATAALNCTRLP